MPRSAKKSKASGRLKLRRKSTSRIVYSEIHSSPVDTQNLVVNTESPSHNRIIESESFSASSPSVKKVRTPTTDENVSKNFHSNDILHKDHGDSPETYSEQSTPLYKSSSKCISTVVDNDSDISDFSEDEVGIQSRKPSATKYVARNSDTLLTSSILQKKKKSKYVFEGSGQNISELLDAAATESCPSNYDVNTQYLEEVEEEANKYDQELTDEFNRSTISDCFNENEKNRKCTGLSQNIKKIYTIENDQSSEDSTNPNPIVPSDCGKRKRIKEFDSNNINQIRKKKIKTGEESSIIDNKKYNTNYKDEIEDLESFMKGYNSKKIKTGEEFRRIDNKNYNTNYKDEIEDVESFMKGYNSPHNVSSTTTSIIKSEENNKITKNSETKRECNICYDAIVDCIIEPCGCISACRKCIAKCSDCPYCRTKICRIGDLLDQSKRDKIRGGEDKKVSNSKRRNNITSKNNNRKNSSTSNNKSQSSIFGLFKKANDRKQHTFGSNNDSSKIKNDRKQNTFGSNNDSSKIKNVRKQNTFGSNHYTLKTIDDIVIESQSDIEDESDDEGVEENVSDEINKKWACNACTFENHQSLSYCEICNQPRKKVLIAPKNRGKIQTTVDNILQSSQDGQRNNSKRTSSGKLNCPRRSPRNHNSSLRDCPRRSPRNHNSSKPIDVSLIDNDDRYNNNNENSSEDDIWQNNNRQNSSLRDCRSIDLTSEVPESNTAQTSSSNYKNHEIFNTCNIKDTSENGIRPKQYSIHPSLRNTFCSVLMANARPTNLKPIIHYQQQFNASDACFGASNNNEKISCECKSMCCTNKCRCKRIGKFCDEFCGCSSKCKNKSASAEIKDRKNNGGYWITDDGIKTFVTSDGKKLTGSRAYKASEKSVCFFFQF